MISGGGQIAQVFKVAKFKVHEKRIIYMLLYVSISSKIKFSCVAGNMCQELCLHNLLSAPNKLAR